MKSTLVLSHVLRIRPNGKSFKICSLIKYVTSAAPNRYSSTSSIPLEFNVGMIPIFKTPQEAVQDAKYMHTCVKI